MQEPQKIGVVLQPQIETLKDQKQNTRLVELDKNRGCNCGGAGWYAVFDSKANMGVGAYRTKVCICHKVARTKIGELPEEFSGKKFFDITIYQKGWNPENQTDTGNALAVSVAKDFISNFEFALSKADRPFL